MWAKIFFGILPSPSWSPRSPSRFPYNVEKKKKKNLYIRTTPRIIIPIIKFIHFILETLEKMDKNIHMIVGLSKLLELFSCNYKTEM